MKEEKNTNKLQITKQEKELLLDEILEKLGLDIKADQLLSLKIKEDSPNPPYDYNALSWKQRIFAAAYETSFGNVTESAKAANVTRNLFYWWMKNNPNFKKYIESLQVKEMAQDLGERAIFRLLEAANPYVAVQFAKMKMRDRGYVDGSEVTPQNTEETVHWFLPDNQRDVDYIQEQTQDIDHQDVKKDNTD